MVRPRSSCSGIPLQVDCSTVRNSFDVIGTLYIGDLFLLVALVDNTCSNAILRLPGTNVGHRYAFLANSTPLAYQLGPRWSSLAAVHRRLCAPFGGEAADGLVGVLVEAEEVADDAAVEERAVGVGVG